jgi:hypothetical protein
MLRTSKYSITVQFDTATGAYLDILTDYYKETYSSLLRKLIESQFTYILDSNICFDLAASTEHKNSQMTLRLPVILDEYTKTLLDEISEESRLSRSDVLRGMVISNCNLVLQSRNQASH